MIIHKYFTFIYNIKVKYNIVNEGLYNFNKTSFIISIIITIVNFSSHLVPCNVVAYPETTSRIFWNTRGFQKIPTHSRAPWGPWTTPNLLEFKGVEPPESSVATAPQNQLERHSGHVSHCVNRTT